MFLLFYIIGMILPSLGIYILGAASFLFTFVFNVSCKPWCGLSILNLIFLFSYQEYLGDLLDIFLKFLPACVYIAFTFVFSTFILFMTFWLLIILIAETRHCKESSHGCWLYSVKMSLSTCNIDDLDNSECCVIKKSFKKRQIISNKKLSLK